MFNSTKIIELGSCAFRQPGATSHCRFLHGYRLTAKFWFEASHLDSNNWVVDFGGLKELKNMLQDQFDHTTCISRSDPKVEEFKRLQQAGVCDLRLMDGVGIEKFAEWCYNLANNFVKNATQNRCWCAKVEVFEHENNSAVYSSEMSQTSQPVVNEAKVEQPAPAKKTAPASTISSNNQKVTNKWIDPNAPKNSWRF